MTLTTVNPALLDTQAQYTGFKNRIINGAMVIDQRNAGAAVTVVGAFPVDRFNIGNSTDGAFSAQQDSSAPTGFNYSLKQTITTADASLASTQAMAIQHWIEGFNVADLNWGTADAKTVTLSFWVNCSLSGTFGGALRNSDASRSHPFSYTIFAANTWEQKSITIAGDTSGTWLKTNGRGIGLIFSLGAGADRVGSAGVWSSANYQGVSGQVQVVGTLNATFYITGVQLEKGSTATSFDYRPYGTELALCQRYFLIVAKNDFYQSGSGLIGTTWAYNSIEADCTLLLPVSMRSFPSLYQTTGTGYYGLRNVNASVSFNSWTALQYFSGNSVNIYANTSGGLTAGACGYSYTNSAGAFLGLSSEL